MRPVGVEQKSGGWVVVQRCEWCGKEWRNKASEDDNFEVLIKICEQNAKGAE